MMYCVDVLCCVAWLMVVGGLAYLMQESTKRKEMKADNTQRKKKKNGKQNGYNPFPKEKDAQWIGSGDASRGVSRALHSFGKRMDYPLILKTSEDLFHGALWAHLLNRHVVYPVPSILNTNDSACMTDIYARGEGSFIDTGTKVFRIEGGSDLYSLGLGPKTAANRVIPFRYMTSTGRVNASKTISVTAGTEQEYWIGFDPSQYQSPVHYLNVTDRATLDGGAINKAEWTTVPHLISTVFEKDATYLKDQPLKKPTRDNDWEQVSALPVAANIRYRNSDCLFWDGGAQLDLEVVNTNAYGVSSMRVVSQDNMAHAYLNELRFVGGVLQDLPMNVPFKRSSSCSVAHSGSEWDTTFYDLATNANERTLASVRAIDRCVRRGKCLIQIRLAATVGNVDFMLNISANSWGATTHFNANKAGALPYETVPFFLPMWFNVGRCNGTVYGERVDERQSRIGINTVARAGALMPSSSPLQVALSDTSPQGIRNNLVAVGPHVAEVQPDSHFRDEMKGAIGALVGQKVLPAVGNMAKKAGTSVLRSVFNFIGRNLANLASRAGPILTEDAPLMIEAAEGMV